MKNFKKSIAILLAQLR